MSRNIFVSYATGSFLEARDQLCKSALNVGFDEVLPRTYEDLEEEFRFKNNEILSQSRGAGYWLWKPQIIIQELKKLQEGDVLVYSDAGRSLYYQFSAMPKNCISLARKYGFLLGPTIGQHGPMSKWTKRDAFVLMNMDDPKIYELPPIQATYSFWTPCKDAFEFLEEWLLACQDPRILTDIENTQGLSNLDDFQDHRHDQAVISLLAFRKNAHYLDYTKSLVEKFLLLRPQSKLANLFLKRIDDVELTLKKTIFRVVFAFIKSWLDLNKN